MKILAIDTSTMTATCAVLENERVLGEYSLDQDLSHSENLVPIIKEVLDNLNLKIRDIDLFGVAIGPGSFTGLRIGIATMKSFAHVFHKPIVGISTLEGLAFNLTSSGVIVPMLDARRERVYTGIYKWEGERLKTILEPCIKEIDTFLQELKKDYDEIMINGNGATLYKEEILDILEDRVKLAPIGLNGCRASSIAELGLLKYEEGYEDNYYNLVPEYLRETYAQRQLNEKESGI